jgi:hypothetical protein
MKQGIFISYSDFDKDKVDLIVNELEGNTKFFPIVIASNREALKPLAQKVADGIIQAKVIIPILTKNSIPTQWINQEIGFATALSKRIMPIVESDLIDKLKGFIHKQIDLPYNFLLNSDKTEEHKDFIKQVRNLLADLEEEFQKLVTAEEFPVKSDFEKSLEQADKLNEELEFQRLRTSYLNSVDGVEAAKTEVLNMYADIEEKIKKLQEKKFYFGFEKEVYQPSFILKSEGFSFSIAWQQQYSNLNEGALLYVRKWNGHLTKDTSAFYFPGEEPKMVSDNKYTFDRNRNNEICWLNQKDKKLYKSEKIVDDCLAWLVEQVAKKRLDRK